MTAAIAILLFVTLQRLGELYLAKRNTEKRLDEGAYEVASEHYLFIVALHTLWLLGLWLFAPQTDVINMFWLIVFGLLQLMRFWVIATLGHRWTTRIIVKPGETPIRNGPYRVIDHPNYAVVAAEIFALPMVFGLTAFAIIFTFLNAVILFIRIRAESQAVTDAESQIA